MMLFSEGFDYAAKQRDFLQPWGMVPTQLWGPSRGASVPGLWTPCDDLLGFYLNELWPSMFLKIVFNLYLTMLSLGYHMFVFQEEANEMLDFLYPGLVDYSLWIKVPAWILVTPLFVILTFAILGIEYVSWLLEVVLLLTMIPLNLVFDLVSAYTRMMATFWKSLFGDDELDLTDHDELDLTAHDELIVPTSASIVPSSPGFFVSDSDLSAKVPDPNADGASVVPVSIAAPIVPIAAPTDAIATSVVYATVLYRR